MTQMYNVLEALREGRALTEKEKEVHDKGLVSVLKDIHDRLDAAVIEAYGWPADISDEEILERLVALNRERAEEEAKGKIRWLRPDYQNPTGAAPKVQDKLDVDVTDIPVAAKAKWPGGLPDQMKLLRSALDSLDKPLTADQIAAAFKGARRKRVEELLETLVSLGQARVTEERRYTVQ